MSAPADPDLPLVHSRDYQVRAYAESETRLRLRGSIHDQKPPGLYVVDDPEPLSVHHMIIDLVVEVPEMTIVDAEVVFEVHPHRQCVQIVDHYGELVGLSIARGFTHKVRELFGGPRGCTHTTALLQAMAPVAIQSIWSLSAHFSRTAEGAEKVPAPRRMTLEQRRERAKRFNLNTCHVWAEDGEFMAELEAGGEMEPPLWIIERLNALGRDPSEWRSAMGEE